MAVSSKTKANDYGKQKRWEAILCSARELFCEVGYEKTKVKDVATRAGVTEPTVYNHFGSKSRMAVEIIRQSDAANQKQIDELISDSKRYSVSEITGLLELFVMNSLSCLDAGTWRYVIAFSAVESDFASGQIYRQLNDRLYGNCSRLLYRWIDMGLVSADCDVDLVCRVLERINHELFREIVTGQISDLTEYRMILRPEVELIMSGWIALSKPGRKRDQCRDQ